MRCGRSEVPVSALINGKARCAGVTARVDKDGVSKLDADGNPTVSVRLNVLLDPVTFDVRTISVAVPTSGCGVKAGDEVGAVEGLVAGAFNGNLYWRADAVTAVSGGMTDEELFGGEANE